tara:strand:- start:815 stop:1129 length:315 start_codon:yes stop_codon:yes gene_type:complete
MENETLYHGTCKAFVKLASQYEGKFGPSDFMWFTPEIEHAKMFAESWQKARGLARLKQMFETEIDPSLAEPVVLEFSSERLRELVREDDAGAVAYRAMGPVEIN